MKGMLVKLISSCILVILSYLLINVNYVRFQIGIATIIFCVIKFLIVTALEPDSIWEIIKKFVYLIVAVFLGIGIWLNNLYFIRILGFILIIDSVWEFVRFFKNLLWFRTTIFKE